VEKMRIWCQGLRRHEVTKWRSGERIGSHPSEKDRWQRSRDLANSGVRRSESPSIGYSKSRSGEVARGLGAIHLRGIGGRDQEISRTREFAG
jgi:hypothetical protein